LALDKPLIKENHESEKLEPEALQAFKDS